MTNNVNFKKRKHIRFLADQNNLATIDFCSNKEDFEPKLVGLVVNESYKGCSVIFTQHVDNKLKKDQEVYIAVGKLAPVPAIVRWLQPIEDFALRMGFEYLV